MADHFVLLVDRLLTESSLEVAIGKNTSTVDARKMVECRICQDEDFDTIMESPCSCCGSLKYAHRRCVQRWCNEKGDTVCEICHQQFKPGYTSPPPLFHLGGIPMNLRRHWEIGRRDLIDPRVIAMVSTDPNFLHPNYDEYADPTSKSLMCCYLLALVFMVLLILRHTLPVIVSRAENFSFPLLMLLLVRSSGIILPFYIIMRAVTTILLRRQQRMSRVLG